MGAYSSFLPQTIIMSADQHLGRRASREGERRADERYVYCLPFRR